MQTGLFQSIVIKIFVCLFKEMQKHVVFEKTGKGKRINNEIAFEYSCFIIWQQLWGEVELYKLKGWGRKKTPQFDNKVISQLPFPFPFSLLEPSPEGICPKAFVEDDTIDRHSDLCRDQLCPPTVNNHCRLTHELPIIKHGLARPCLTSLNPYKDTIVIPVQLMIREVG